MGGFYGSIHVRADSNQLIKVALEKIAKKKRHKFYLSPPINGWVGIFPDGYGQDERVSKHIAKQLDYDVLHLMVHDDDIFCYWYYRNGTLFDVYNSRPDYFGNFVSRKKREKLKGSPEVFKDLVDNQNKMDEIFKILSAPSAFNKNVQVDPKFMEKAKRFEEISKKIQKFFYDPNAIAKFLSENPHLLDEKTKSLVQEAKNKCLKSPKEIKKLITKSENLRDLIGKIVPAFLKTQGFLNETGTWKEDMFEIPLNPTDNKIKAKEDVIDKVEPLQPPPGLFAGDSMNKFAELLGIPNAVTSYEYLAGGETVNILEWDRFVEVS
ncbi:MAG: hypothetical protein JW749_02675 [Sedimentisphaerales bacterium]|nr:hypothetical protein [Sedimentisphaerales bacterium]